MDGFKIAIATKDGDQEDLILIGAEESTEERTMIDSVEIFFDTTDDNVRSKSSSMLAKIEIKGKISDEIAMMKKLRKLSEWAHDRSSDTAYRDVCIGMKAKEDIYQVVYTLKNVFVVDYKENYTLSEAGSCFELRLTQRENNMDNIEILSDWPSDPKFGQKS